jgi:PIN domain nuclease of toxin-antitoxin system
MNYLIDTHAFIWWAVEPVKLSAKVFGIFESSESNLFLSIASIWEMQIKIQLQKISLPLPLSELVLMQQQFNNLRILPIELRHIYMLETLPLHHRDPFDRIMIAQSVLNNMVFVSRDSEFEKYPIRVLW